MADPAPIDDEARADTLDVLSDLLVWELPAQRWEQVERIVEVIAAALDAGDATSLNDATVELEMLGPVRATRIGTTPVLPVPERVRDRANHLVHSLGSTSPEPERDRNTPTAGSGGADAGKQPG